MTAEREPQEKVMYAELARQRALLIAESTAKKRKLAEKKKAVERLEELKRHNTAKARLQVYAEEDLQDPPASASQGRAGNHVTASNMSDPGILLFVSLQGKVLLSKPNPPQDLETAMHQANI